MAFTSQKMRVNNLKKGKNQLSLAAGRNTVCLPEIWNLERKEYAERTGKLIEPNVGLFPEEDSNLCRVGSENLEGQI
jgi:hypothetical protein